MIAVDLDGTLLNSRKSISEEDRAALVEAAARGVEIVPVTGRNYSTALPIVAELLASGPTSGPLIASNGAIIRSKEGETHLRGLLPVAVAAEVLRITPEFRHYTVVTYDQHGEGQDEADQAGQPKAGIFEDGLQAVAMPGGDVVGVVEQVEQLQQRHEPDQRHRQMHGEQAGGIAA